MQLIDALNLSDRELLARTLMAEAGNGSINDMLPVGNVIMNRARQGGTLQDVILAPAQFSPWNTTKMPDGSLLYAAGKGQGRDMGGIKPSKSAYVVADALLSGEAVDVTEGATHFFNPSISKPSWAKGMAGTKIGSHLFGSAGGFRTGVPKIQTQQPLSATSGIGSGSLLSKEPEMSMNPNTPPRSGLLGFMDIMRQQDPETGMTAMERFGAALDPLVRPNERMGEQFRASGARRLQTQSKNKTIETLRQRAQAGDQLAMMVLQGLESGAYDAKTAMSLYMGKKLEAPSTKETFTTATGSQLNEQFGTELDPTKMYNVSSSGKISQVGGAGVNIAGPEKEYEKRMGAAYADRNIQMSEETGNALNTLRTIEIQENLIQDPAFQSGQGQALFDAARGFLSRFGVEEADLASNTAFKAFAQKSVIDQLGGSLGTGVSNADVGFITGTVANLDNSGQSIALLLNLKRKLAERQLKIAEVARDWKKQNNTNFLTEDWDQYLQKWSMENPLFPDANDLL